jgi:hypothetical protein
MIRSPGILTSSIIGCWLFAAGAACAAPLEQVEKKGDAVIRAQVDRDIVNLSQSVVLTVTVEAKAPLEIEPIKKVTASIAWDVTVSAPQTAALPQGRMRWQQSFRLAPLGKDDLPLPLEPLRFRAGGEDIEIIWKPFTLKVLTVVASPSMAGIKDITPPVQVPQPDEWSWWLLAAAAAILIFFWVVVLVVRKRRKTAPPLPEPAADAWALAELQRLEKLALPASGQVERYHTLLADVIRAYLDRRLGVRTAERTTGEFLTALAESGKLPAEQLDQLRRFFERCDLAKYARAAYPPEECQVAARMAQEFVQQSTAWLAARAAAANNGQATPQPASAGETS